MKVSLKKDTLAYQMGVRPTTQKRKMGWVQVPHVVKSLNSFMGVKDLYKTPGSVSSILKSEEASGHPEIDALMFYMLNHSVSLVASRVHPLEPLGDYLPLVEMYHQELALRSTRMFYYLLLICTRESRHEKKSSAASALHSKYGAEISKFHTSLHGCSSMGAADVLMKTPPKVDIGSYTSFLVDVFNQGSWSSGFGGKAWGEVARVLRDFVLGDITAEMMMDTSFTLCHNNGPIFNKGMLYSSYSSGIYKILDVQRSGQIPELVACKGVSQASAVQVQTAYSLCNKLVGDSFGPYVDWFKVEDLGALKKYPVEKDLQKKAHGTPSGSKAAKSFNEAVDKMKKSVMDSLEQSKIEIFPSLFITKLKGRA